MEKVKFEKYNSIENHYMTKSINRYYREFPELEEDTIFQITEKIDGSNCVIRITKDTMHFGKRTQFIGKGTDFRGMRQVIESEHIQKFINAVKEIAEDDVYTFYGEFYGTGIQRRIKYCNGKDIKLFDFKINGELQSPERLIVFLKQLNHFNLHVPIIENVKGLDACIEYDTEFDSKLFEADKDHPKAQECEGVVIKPYSKAYFAGEKRIVIKKKNKKFSEKMKASPKDPKKWTPEQIEFMGYINENRLLSVISKYGKPVDNSDIGKFIGLLSDDALTDYKADNNIEEISKSKTKELKSIIGRIAQPLIKAQF